MAGKHNFNRPTIRPTFVGSSTRAGGTTSDTPSLHIRAPAHPGGRRHEEISWPACVLNRQGPARPRAAMVVGSDGCGSRWFWAAMTGRDEFGQPSVF